MGIRMPPTYQTEGRAAAIEIRHGCPGVELLPLSQHLETRYLTKLLGTSARGVGYLLKERVSGIARLVAAAAAR